MTREVSQKNLEKIFRVICTLQMKSHLEPVKKIQVKRVLAKPWIIGDPFTSKSKTKPPSEYALDKLMTRAFPILVKEGKIVSYPKNSGQYWMPACLKDYKQFQERKKDFLQQMAFKDEVIAEKEKEITKKNKDLAFARTFLHAIKFCRTDEDWELLNAFYKKMRANEKAQSENLKKYLKENQEAQEETQKANAELSKEIDQDKKLVKHQQKYVEELKKFKLS